MDEEEKNNSNEESTKEKDSISKDEIKNKIISMHKDGFSEVEIAKKCGIGIGEIKLILGLFDGV